MFMLVSCIESDTPSSVAKKYLTYIKDGNYEKAVDMIHFKKEMTKEDKQQVVSLMEDKMKSAYGEQGNISDIEITGEEIEEDGEHAKVTYKYMDAKKDKEKTDKMKLVKIDGKWMVDAGK